MRTTLLFTLTIAMIAGSSASAQQSSYRNTRIQPRPVPPEQQLDLPPARIQLQSPVPSRVAVVQPNVTNNVLPQTQDEPAPVATPAPAAPAITPAPTATPAVTATPAPAATPTPAATAQEPVVEETVAQQPVPQQPVRYYRPQQQPQQRQGFFGRLMEVERRKNAWLRRRFLQ